MPTKIIKRKISRVSKLAADNQTVFQLKQLANTKKTDHS